MQTVCGGGGPLEFPFVAVTFTHQLPSQCHRHVWERSVPNQEIFLCVEINFLMRQSATLVQNKGQQLLRRALKKDTRNNNVQLHQRETNQRQLYTHMWNN